MAERSETQNKIKSSYPHVDMVFGTKPPQEFTALISDIQRRPPPSASIPIISGCDNFCSYCIVPYVRGRETSRPVSDVLEEAAGLVEAGYRELLLLGQNVNSYRDGNVRFPGLLDAICAIEGDFWVRFMTSHPKDCSVELIEFMAKSPKMARQLHLPVQAGSNNILKAMNRKYTAEHYRGLIKYARELMPDIAITSDIIVGFPGETEEDFQETLQLIDDIKFDALFTFIYSPRSDTPAASLEQIPRPITQKRFEKLLELQNNISHSKHAAFLGTTQRVLFDGFDQSNERPLSGRTSGGRMVRVAGDYNIDCVGRFMDVKITGHNSWNLFG